MELRILLLALRGRDASVLEHLLTQAGHACHVCDGVEMLARELHLGAGAALVTEESLVESTALSAWLGAQLPWSDFPFILLATKRSGRRTAEAADVLDRLGNVVVLERPIHAETLSSAVTSALRVRRRQYEARSHLEELRQAEERLKDANATLETRIAERTHQLSSANNQLMQEVAERERVQAALAQAQKMEAVGQLTGGIAHDFNNLLTVVLGNLELIERRTTDERTERLAVNARQAGDRAATLTQQLLAFSRAQKLTLAPVDINALILGMNDLLVRTIGSQIEIEMTLDAAAPWATADANQLELAILNLAINARDAMPDGGTLCVCSAVSPEDSAVVVTVSDTGSGIPAHLIEKVFDPFFTTKPIGKGTGLGLSQVYGIAEQSGGTVRIDSAEGRGSRVEIRLLRAEPGDAREGRASSAAPATAGSREHVLVIDDDDGVRGFVVESLGMLGYEVSHAGNGPDGLALLSKRPDLVIVDYAMPGMNGVQVIAGVRAAHPDMPIVLATGYADMAAVGEVLDARHVLRKPFKVEDLDTAIRAALESRAPERTAHQSG